MIMEGKILINGVETNGQAKEILENAVAVKGRPFEIFLRTSVNLMTVHSMLEFYASRGGPHPHAGRDVAMALSALDQAMYDLAKALGISETDAKEAVNVVAAALRASNRAGG